MSARVEARRLSGADLGKTITGEDRISNDSFAGTLTTISHLAPSPDGLPNYVALLVIDEVPEPVYLHPTDPVTLTGTDEEAARQISQGHRTTSAGRCCAALQRVEIFAEEMRSYCWPHGVAQDYADRLQAALRGDTKMATHEIVYGDSTTSVCLCGARIPSDAASVEAHMYPITPDEQQQLSDADPEES